MHTSGVFECDAALVTPSCPLWHLRHPGGIKGGKTLEELTKEEVSYEVGIAKYSELAKSMMLGDENGMLKLLFNWNNRKLLGVHAIGERATEIIYIGQVFSHMVARLNISAIQSSITHSRGSLQSRRPRWFE